MSLLTTKLYVPPLRAKLVQRLRLVERLEEALRLGHRLILISAPAGFGKTTLVTDWCQGRRKASLACTWLSLDEQDNDPVRFLTYLLAALQTIDPTVGQATSAMLQASPPPPPESLLTSLINDLAETPRPFVLVLDDYQTIQAVPVHRQLGFLLEHQPLQMHLVIATREDPPLNLSRLRACGQITEIRQRDLQFTEEEAAGFLQRTMALEVSPADVTALHRCTEGWIAGLQLAALSMQQSDDVRQFVTNLTGSDRYILDYLVEEVLQRQTPGMQDFLLKTSILDRLNAALCDAVTERTDSQQVLQTLDQANLFIVPLDESRQSYRYHRLFRDLLRTRRAALDEASLHRRAARWYEANGFLGDAMTHALVARDWDEAERLVPRACAEAVKNGQFHTLSRWLGALPDALVRERPAFATLKAWASLAMGQQDAAEASADLAEALMPAGAPPYDRGVLVALRTYISLARRDVARTIQLATDALTLLAAGDPYFARGAVLNNLAQAQVMAGDIAAATRTYRQLLKQSQGVHPLSSVSALSHLADTLDIQGQRTEAMSLCQQAVDQCMDARGRPLPPAGLAHILLGRMCYEGNDLSVARQHLLQGLELARLLSRASMPVAGMMELARLQLAAGEGQAALATVEEIRQLTAQLNWPYMDSVVAALEAEFALRHGDIAAVERWAQSAGMAPTGWPSHARESEYLTYARLLLAQDRPEDAQRLLANLEQFASEGGRLRSLITIRILQALAQLASGDREQALLLLEEAVRLAAPEGYRRAFLDEGQAVLALLPNVQRQAPEFVESLLGHGTAQAPNDTLPSAGQPLIEALSGRELEVLELVAAGLSNRDIAARLFVSVGTVKTHVHHVCAKLAASSRTQAAARARDLGLL